MARRFTTSEDEIIREMFGKFFFREIAEKLNRNLGSVHTRAKVLGLQLTVDQRKANMLIGSKIGSKKNHSGRFKKGHTSWNKGMKGYRPSKRTEFKKGHQPHNTKHDGFISVRSDTKTHVKYKYIRISKAEWMPLHHYNWIKKHGPIPEGMVIIFKDGDQMNIEINEVDNLKMISLAENMKRNSIHNYTPEVFKVVQLMGALNRQINNINKYKNVK